MHFSKLVLFQAQFQTNYGDLDKVSLFSYKRRNNYRQQENEGKLASRVQKRWQDLWRWAMEEAGLQRYEQETAKYRNIQG